MVQGAQFQQFGPVSAGNGQFARRRASRQNQHIVRLDGSIGEGHRLGSPVDGRRCDAGAQIDGLFGVEALRAQQQVFQTRLSLQPSLGQGRPLIGRRRLLARQDNLALKAILPQQRRRRAPRVSRADNQNLGHDQTDRAARREWRGAKTRQSRAVRLSLAFRIETRPQACGRPMPSWGPRP
ncbi:hypothetical protein D3C81_1555730 [compost metagenome]